jgi:hypothetical protein
VATEIEIDVSDDYGPMAGFRNMMRKENARWWTSNQWRFSYSMAVVLNALGGILFIVPP